MSKNIDQIFIANPASSMQTSDLLYLGRSPYGATDDFAITFANFSGSLGSITPTASTLAKWDSNVNLNTNSILNGYTQYAIYFGDLYLTPTSTYYQFVTNASAGHTLTMHLPDVTAYTNYSIRFKIYNESSSSGNTIYVRDSSGGLLLILNGSESAEFSSGSSNSWHIRDVIKITNNTVIQCLQIITLSLSNLTNIQFYLQERTTGTGPFNINGATDGYYQSFVGSSADSVYLPSSAGLEGYNIELINKSSGLISVYSSDDSSLIATIVASSHKKFICITEVYGGAADWYYY